MADLTESQLILLRSLNAGHRIAYSQDGDSGWLTGTHDHLADADIWALRNLQYIEQESDEREDHYGQDSISPAGRAALQEAGR